MYYYEQFLGDCSTFQCKLERELSFYESNDADETSPDQTRFNSYWPGVAYMRGWNSRNSRRIASQIPQFLL